MSRRGNGCCPVTLANIMALLVTLILRGVDVESCSESERQQDVTPEQTEQTVLDAAICDDRLVVRDTLDLDRSNSSSDRWLMAIMRMLLVALRRLIAEASSRLDEWPPSCTADVTSSDVAAAAATRHIQLLLEMSIEPVK